MDKNINKTYPISNENYQQIINFKENLSLYQKVETFIHMLVLIFVLLQIVLQLLFGPHLLK